jgi:hypothetical protein
MQRGGFFKSVFKSVAKVVKTVTKVPVVGTIAKAAISSLPIVGQVTTAVAAFKSKTPVGTAQSPVGGVQPTASAVVNQPVVSRAPRGARRARPKKRKKAKRSSSRRGGGSPKQIAARKRFAAAARRGRIKKGQRL